MMYLKFKKLLIQRLLVCKIKECITKHFIHSELNLQTFQLAFKNLKKIINPQDHTHRGINSFDLSINSKELIEFIYLINYLKPKMT